VALVTHVVGIVGHRLSLKVDISGGSPFAERCEERAALQDHAVSVRRL
jgi:hypothetical protein